jgi:monofunctional chorismate mutase
MTDLEHLRKEIDAIDEKLVRLLERRMDIARQVGEYKEANALPVLDKKREEEIIQSRVNMLSDPTLQDTVTGIFTLIMRYSRMHQRKDFED